MGEPEEEPYGAGFPKFRDEGRHKSLSLMKSAVIQNTRFRSFPLQASQTAWNFLQHV